RLFSSNLLRRNLVRVEHQALDAAAVLDVRFEDLVDVGFGPTGVPDAFRIDDDGRPELAAVEAAGVVDADIADAELLRLLLHIGPQLFRALLAAATPRMAGRARVGAAENVLVVKQRRILNAPLTAVSHASALLAVR